MFKKILLIILVFSPLWYSLLIGYPIISDEQHQMKQLLRPNISISKRCFSVGDFKQYTDCFAISQKLNGSAFVSEVTGKINTISVVATVILFLSLGLFIIASIILVTSQ